MSLSDFRSSKLFQSYIISGQGSGKRELAEMLAKKAVCSGGGQPPCGTCEDCRKATAGIHPDIVFVDPPFEKGEYKYYQVDIIRNMCADSVVLPNDARRKVYIITDAARLSTICQNALLKTLEEPSSHSVFILISENSGNLLPTVRSRCVEISVSPEKDAPLCSESVCNTVSGLMNTFSSGNRLKAAEYLLSLEGMSKSEAAELSAEMLRRCAAAIRENSLGRGCGISTEKLIHMTEVFIEIRKYLDFNVSTGHIVGLLMAELL